MKNREPLSSVDQAWLRLERDDNPVMITALMVLERPLDLRRFLGVLRTRLLAFDRFSQRVVRQGDNAWWVDDPHFSLNNHVHVIGLPGRADKRALQQLTGDLASTPLDFRHPLWQVHVIAPYGDGAALLFRIHHCIGDGSALVQVLLSLADAWPDGGPQPPKSRAGRRRIRHPASDWVRGNFYLGRRALASMRDLVRHPGRVRELAGDAFNAGSTLAHLGLMPADPPGPLKGELCGRKRVAWAAPLDLAEVKRVARALDGSVNDVLMACASGALRAYLGGKNQDVERPVHVTVPFNLRPPGRPIEHLGNRFGFVIARLPVEIPDPRARFEAVRRQMTALKHSPQPIIFYGMLNAFGWGPERIQRIALNILSDKSTLVMTNVAGPRRPLYLAGSRVLQPMVWAPQSGRIGLGITLFSYADTVQFGVVADNNLVARPAELVRYFVNSFKELAEEADGCPGMSVENEPATIGSTTRA